MNWQESFNRTQTLISISYDTICGIHFLLGIRTMMLRYCTADFSSLMVKRMNAKRCLENCENLSYMEDHVMRSDTHWTRNTQDQWQELKTIIVWFYEMAHRMLSFAVAITQERRSGGNSANTLASPLELGSALGERMPLM
jgi:hypothetical protein